MAKSNLDRFASSFDKSALTFKNNDMLHVTKQYENGLWYGSVVDGRRRGKKGHFPFTMVDVQDSAAFNDDDMKATQLAFMVNELKKQGVDINKLMKAGAKAPPSLQHKAAPKFVAPKQITAPAGGGGAPPPPRGAKPSPTVYEAAEYSPLPAPGRPPPPAAPAGDDDNFYGATEQYGEEEEDMIYGMTDSFDANAVEAMMEEIYGVI